MVFLSLVFFFSFIPFRVRLIYGITRKLSSFWQIERIWYHMCQRTEEAINYEQSLPITFHMFELFLRGRRVQQN